MNKLVLLISAFLIGCAAPSYKREPELDSRLASSLSCWKADMTGAKLDWVSGFSRINRIVVGELPSGKLGLYDQWICSVTVSDLAVGEGPYSTRATLYHELGHAVFGLEHGSCAIMGTGMNEDWWRENWDSVKQEYILEIK